MKAEDPATVRSPSLVPRHSQRIEVVAAVVLGPDGRFLLGQRPAGKVYAGYWEFPGGKVEPGESPLAALKRELREELGDVLLQVLFQARIAEDAPEHPFTIDDVADTLQRKLANRVPAVLAGE